MSSWYWTKGDDSFSEKWNHTNVTFHPNGTISGEPSHPLHWLPELSNGTEDDIIVVPNLSLLAFANLVEDLPFLASWGLNLLIVQKDTQPFLRLTAREYMFTLEDPFVDLGNKFLPSWIYFKRVGLLERIYDFTNNTFTVFTGETDLKLSGLIDTYNGRRHLPQWEGAHCSNVTGSSDSTKYQNSIGPGEKLFCFRKSVCRKMPLVRNGSLTLSGLTAHSFYFEENALDNGKYNQDNKCYCRKGKCLPVGLIDAQDCYYGFPIAVSYPHFYQGDPSIWQHIRGVTPDEHKHQSYYHVVPEAGLPIRVASRFQVNFNLGNLTKTLRVGSFRNTVIPLLWLEVGMEDLPTLMNLYFYFSLVVLPIAQTVVIYLLLCVGISLMILCLLKWFQRTLKEDTKPRPRPRPGHRALQVRASKFLDRLQDDAHRDLNWRAYHAWLLDNTRETDIL